MYPSTSHVSPSLFTRASSHLSLSLSLFSSNVRHILLLACRRRFVVHVIHGVFRGEWTKVEGVFGCCAFFFAGWVGTRRVGSVQGRITLKHKISISPSGSRCRETIKLSLIRKTFVFAYFWQPCASCTIGTSNYPSAPWSLLCESVRHILPVAQSSLSRVSRGIENEPSS